MADQRGGNVIDLTDKPTAARDASASIVKIINAMADAKTSQTELQKQIMLKQVNDKMDIQKQAASSHQQNLFDIEKKNMNINWASGSPLDSNPFSASPTDGGGSGNIGGVANSQTPNAIASPGGNQPIVSPVGGAMPQGQPAASVPAPNPTPTLAATAQPKQMPQLNGITPTPINSATTVTAGGGAPAVNIPSPIGKPLPPPPGRVVIGPDGKPALNPNANSPDNKTYTGIYNKWKSGQPLSDGETKWVQNKFSNGPDGKPLAKNNADTSTAATANLPPFQKAIMNIKAKMGPQYTLDGEGNVVQDPVYMSLIKAKQDAIAKVQADQPNVDRARQDKLFNQAVSDIAVKQVSYRSGSIGTQDAKVSQAVHARQLINQAYDPKTGQYDVTQVPYGELSESLGNLLSGGTGSSDARIAALKQATLSGDINKMKTYIDGVPSNATSQDVLKQLVKMIDRQGVTSEEIRDGDLDRLKHSVLDGSGLSSDSKKSMFNSPPVGVSYKEYMNKSPDYQASQIPENRPAGATHYSPSTKQFYDDQGNVVK